MPADLLSTALAKSGIDFLSEMKNEDAKAMQSAVSPKVIYCPQQLPTNFRTSGPNTLPQSSSNVLRQITTNILRAPPTNIVQAPITKIVRPPITKIVRPPITKIVKPPPMNTVRVPLSNIVRVSSSNSTWTPSLNTVQVPLSNIVQVPSPNIVQVPSPNIVRTPPTNIVRTLPTNIVRTPPMNIVRTPPMNIVRTPPMNVVRVPLPNVGQTPQSNVRVPLPNVGQTPQSNVRVPVPNVGQTPQSNVRVPLPNIVQALPKMFVRALPTNIVQASPTNIKQAPKIMRETLSTNRRVSQINIVPSTNNGRPPVTSYCTPNNEHNLSYHDGSISPMVASEVPTPEVEEEDELGLAETYANYMPSKLRFGERHPDPVVETSSLSSIPPPDIWYKLSIPEEVIDDGSLSALQLEAITYACQKHDTILPDGNRAGYLIGDGAGVGKGRTLAGIIVENYTLGRKRSLWLSVSNDLKYDAIRDLSDIGADKIKVHSLNKFKYAKISSKVNGSVKKGVVFATYSSLIGESHSEGKYNTRLKQISHWCGDNFDGCIIFDECHKAKNLCPVGSTKPTKTGLTVLELQNKLPKARIVYASATGASEPRNMAYMTRLGLWGIGTPFKEFADFIAVVEKRGVGAMELVAMDMKLRGLYIARQLSFSGVTFKVEEIPLTPAFKNMYDQSVSLWVDAYAKFSEAAKLLPGDVRTNRTMWCQFWASQQRFFKYLCIASKVDHVVHLTREAMKNGKCVVIGLQSTGEARTAEQVEEQGGELTDFVSTAKGVFQSLIEKQFPSTDRKKIEKLLGMKFQNQSNCKRDEDQCGSVSPIPTTSRGLKRKTSGGGIQNAKRYKGVQSSDESSSDKGRDFKSSRNETEEGSASGSDSENKVYSFNNYRDNCDWLFSIIEQREKENSDQESDHNPFKDDTDSDDNISYLRAREIIKRKHKKKRKVKAQPIFIKNQPSEKMASSDPADKANRMKEELLCRLEELGNILPRNTLDQLIDDLGGPDNVAEMTGRKARTINNNGTIQYESRTENDVPLETLNITEKQRFMDGEKHIAIISEAASSGISLQSDRRVKNQARRVHMTLELPWSADRAIQQFGRTHRSNQVNAPEYLFLISDLAGERRFASIVAKRLESLGALTHGDRRATESRDLSMFNFDTKYGRSALEQMMQVIIGQLPPLVLPPRDYSGDFFDDVRNSLSGVGVISRDPYTNNIFLEKSINISKFLNRLLCVPVDLQNALFKYFTDTLDDVIQQAKKSGRYDLGILDLGVGGGQVKRIKCHSFLTSTETVKTELHTVLVERGLIWEDAMEKWMHIENKNEGFYLSSQNRNNRNTAILALLDTGRSRLIKKDSEKLFRVFRPNTGLQAKLETLGDLKSKYRKCNNVEVEKHWKENFNYSKNQCSHMYWFGTCRRQLEEFHCEVGLRQRTYHVLSGSVLSVWSKVEAVLSSVTGGHNAKLQVVRLRADDKDSTKIVGCLIPDNAIQNLISVFSKDADKVVEKKF